MIDMRNIATVAEELNYDLEVINRELKRLASVKCRIKKMPGRSDFQEKLTEVLQEEEMMKCVKAYVVGPRKNVNYLTQDEVDSMTLDETMKALKAIQSKKTHTKWLTTEPGDNDEYREACRIEQMLKDHRDSMAPKKLGMLGKNDVMQMLDTVGMCNDLTAEECIEQLRRMIKEG